MQRPELPGQRTRFAPIRCGPDAFQPTLTGRPPNRRLIPDLEGSPDLGKPLPTRSGWAALKSPQLPIQLALASEEC
jgi:hypothetical protein